MTYCIRAFPVWENILPWLCTATNQPFQSQAHNANSPNHSRGKWLSEVVRNDCSINFHLSKLSIAKFSILYDIYIWWETERENWSWSLLGVKCTLKLFGSFFVGIHFIQNLSAGVKVYNIQCISANTQVVPSRGNMYSLWFIPRETWDDVIHMHSLEFCASRMTICASWMQWRALDTTLIYDVTIDQCTSQN